MATYGEIVEPISRTAWEDWDDVLPENNYTKLEWLSKIDVPEIIDTLFILEGKYLHDCIKNQAEYNLKRLDAVKEVDMGLYKMNQSNMYIIVIKDYNILQSSEIVELLKPFITMSNNVITIQTKPLIEYQSVELINRSCLIRIISTSKPLKLDFNFPKLEQPNFISGVSAGAISLREHLNLSGKAIICYIEHPEEYQVEEIQSLLKELKVISNTKLKPRNVLNSNLYI